MNEENTYDKIYEVVEKIPFGRVTSYGAIANFIGLKSGARMVGYAMNASHSREGIPAHRVVNRNGLLTGRHHFHPAELMAQLLESEGVEVENNQIKNFKMYFWDPNQEGEK